ncbi:9677_t:CDS:2 [Racocetra fulgida]|uniref:9677_t:CDS:1 n=1 Tax=Racocetra fulgida TaxID=60492 RepID=A0A9N8YYJ0_9GLOM|nr:9677_t:CDS:2 [Racocetra fulgida]
MIPLSYVLVARAKVALIQIIYIPIIPNNDIIDIIVSENRLIYLELEQIWAE